MRRFYSSTINVSLKEFSLDKEQSRHLRSVLRLDIGDEVHVFDGNGNEFLCVILEFESGGKTGLLRILNEVSPTAPESSLEITLAIGILKGDKFDLVIQKAVELGVTQFIPIITKRCDVKLRNTERKLKRWEKIIVEASKQCGRAKLMRIVEPLEFKEFIDDSEGSKILFYERKAETLSKITLDKKLTAIIGPEGGWEDSEIEYAKVNEIQIVNLNGRILRAETAAISITAILQHRYGDLN